MRVHLDLVLDLMRAKQREQEQEDLDDSDTGYEDHDQEGKNEDGQRRARRRKVRLNWDAPRGRKDDSGKMQMGREHLRDADPRTILLEQWVASGTLRIGIPAGRVR
jgi:hypothetical protein